MARIKYSRKDLKEPDEFITTLGRATAWVGENRTRVAAAAAVAVIVTAAVLGTRAYSRWQERKAAGELWPHLNRAGELLRAPGQADPQKLAELEQVLHSLVERHPSTRAARFARYHLGGIAYLQGDFEESAGRFRSALSSGRESDTLMDFLVRQGYAQALEARGDASEAAEAYRDAAAHASGELRTQAWMGEARALAALGKTAEAADLYRKILAENPDSPMRQYIELQLSRTG